jgi:hypothetical protein
VPAWEHWNGLRRFGAFDASTSIEETTPGTSWRRYLNCVGYPLLGPYDSGQPDIIRWQLETARRAGLACLHVHLWPSIRDEGGDFGPLPIFESVLDEAAALSYPVGVHDEVMFRGRELGGAQDVASSIRRLAGLVKRYCRHAGWYKVDGMPLVYFQNWNRWLSAPDMQRLFREVDEQAGPGSGRFDGSTLPGDPGQAAAGEVRGPRLSDPDCERPARDGPLIDSSRCPHTSRRAVRERAR